MERRCELKQRMAVGILAFGFAVSCGSGDGGSGGGVCGDVLDKVERCCNQQRSSSDASEFTSRCEQAIQGMTSQEQAGIRDLVNKPCDDFMAEMQKQGYPGCQ